jgi:GAF domain-containing protein
VASLLDSFRDRELLAFGLHDCYAREWLDSYEDLLQELAQFERFSPPTSCAI